MIYLDQAASSFPKPTTVADAMVKAVNEYGANPGRSGHQLSKCASAVIDKTREKVQKMFRNQSVDRVVFSLNATTALNQAIDGLSWKRGDHVVATTFEHNSVRRPLERLKKEKGVLVDYVRPNEDEKTWEEAILNKITSNTKLVIVTHGSNVTGEIIPVESIGVSLKNSGVMYCVDASQTAGVLPIDMEAMNIDMLAFPGHKGLLGPQGVGVLLVKNHVNLRPINVGGTGSHSEELEQPKIWPAGWESGTLNTPGIAGLLKGIQEVEKRGLSTIFEHEKSLSIHCIKGLKKLPGIHIVGPGEEENRLGVVSFYIDGVDGLEVAMILDEHYQIAVRAGLHCAPLTHESYETSDKGVIRASFGIYNTKEEVDQLVAAIEEIKDGLLE
ncbi:aminotransferase class V-fold PLP-dependent enzyme [Salipaludibacillus daqingensis]|uniref:aminotransferase class V-fold PLP-dependent enzyme n=1 Tax=Salipaludibacillus daqingensis TaxID=3041001 RepID=UPI0024766E2C|nr:aminotransferase class V-fold PLP-dependent enzyme [Salipaludibacillus daqingensis]